MCWHTLLRSARLGWVLAILHWVAADLHAEQIQNAAAVLLWVRIYPEEHRKEKARQAHGLPGPCRDFMATHMHGI